MTDIVVSIFILQAEGRRFESLNAHFKIKDLQEIVSPFLIIDKNEIHIKNCFSYRYLPIQINVVIL